MFVGKRCVVEWAVHVVTIGVFNADLCTDGVFDDVFNDDLVTVGVVNDVFGDDLVTVGVFNDVFNDDFCSGICCGRRIGNGRRGRWVGLYPVGAGPAEIRDRIFAGSAGCRKVAQDRESTIEVAAKPLFFGGVQHRPLHGGHAAPQVAFQQQGEADAVVPPCGAGPRSVLVGIGETRETGPGGFELAGGKRGAAVRQ